MDAEDLRVCAALLEEQRWAALATEGSDGPLASMVAFALDAEAGGVLMHLSTLAPHTRNLVDSGRASLVVSQPDRGDADPQTLARLTLSGAVVALQGDEAGHDRARARYLRRLPAAEPRFSFTDFGLYRLVPARIAFVGGFARARSLEGGAFMAALRGHAEAAGLAR